MFIIRGHLQWMLLTETKESARFMEVSVIQVSVLWRECYNECYDVINYVLSWNVKVSNLKKFPSYGMSFLRDFTAASLTLKKEHIMFLQNVQNEFSIAPIVEYFQVILKKYDNCFVWEFHYCKILRNSWRYL